MCKITEHTLRLIIRMVTKKSAVTEKESKDDLKAAEQEVTERTTSNELHLHLL